jgi:hypothetical protein
VPVDSEIEAALPDYVIERELGRGGMGVVFLGSHTRLGRRVAIKELPPSFAADPEVRQRFSTEARTLASLAHPHIVPIYDYVERDGICLIVMEELPGGTVWDRFTGAGLTPPTACAIVLACCAALQHAHDGGVLHLDVKPDNLMFAPNTAIKVTDFGISRVISGDHTLGTVDGQVLGTPAYMSPEQARGDELTLASDVYSTGIMLYELLSGHLPWTGAETATELLLQRLREAPRPIHEIAPQVPVALANAVMKAIQREPKDRYRSAEEFGVAIASACAEAWGPNWLDAAGVKLIGSERLSMAARTTSRQPIAPIVGDITTTAAPSGTHAPMTITGETIPDAIVTGPEHASETIVAGVPVAPAASVAASPEVEAAPSAPEMPQFEVVRAAAAEPRLEGANLNDIGRDAFVDVKQVFGTQASPRVWLLATILLFVAAVVACVLLFEPPAHDGTLKRGQVTLAGVDISQNSATLDTSTGIPLRIKENTGPAFANHATLNLSAAGVPLGKTSATVVKGKAVFKTDALRYLASGTLAGKLELQRGSKQLASETFPATIDRAWYLTAFGLGSLVLLLAGLAYLESSVRPLRRGRRRISSFIGCALSVAVMAVGAIAFATALGHANPTTAGVVVAAALAAAGGVALAVTLRRVALHKGIRRAVKHAERAYSVSTA